jgi:DNA-binding transcriptional LysR family regulator
MELRHLRYFVEVAQALSFTKAAQSLRVAQPALSRQIRQLEEEVGVRLLERTRRGVQMTSAGEAFLVEARAVLEQSAQAIQVAQKTGQGKAGQLNLGYVWGLFHSMVPPVVASFRQVHPDVAVHLFDLTATQQVQAIAQGRLDVGFVGFAQEADAAGLTKRKVGESGFIVALPQTHRAARRRRVPLALLAEDFFFTISDQHYPGASRYVVNACAAAGFRPRVLQAAERGHTILGLVAGQCGVAVLPEPLRALPHPGVVFRPLVDDVQADLFLAWDSARNSTVRDAFLRAIPGKSGNARKRPAAP